MFIYEQGWPSSSPKFNFLPDYRNYKGGAAKQELGVLRAEVAKKEIKKVAVNPAPIFKPMESLELPGKLFSFDVGKYTPNNPNEADTKIKEIAEKIKTGLAGKKQIKINLDGVADITPFTVTNIRGKEQILIGRSEPWKEDFGRALKNMDSTGRLKKLMGLSQGAYSKFSAELKIKDVEAIKDLPIKTQQLIMNHAVAHLRGEFIEKKLMQALGSSQGITFAINTEQTNKSGTRFAKIGSILESEPRAEGFKIMQAVGPKVIQIQQAVGQKIPKQ